MKIAIFAGDGIGPEVTEQARRVLETLALPGLTLFEGDVGAAAYRRHGHPLPPETLEMARAADAVLFGAVGDFSCDDLPRALRPEQAILGLRSELGLFANLRPAAGFPGLEHLSSLKPDVARSIDLLVVRELNGDVYFGEKGERDSTGGREGWDAMSYNEAEVRRIAHTGFRAAMGRGKRLTSVDKANVLETSRIWRETVIEVAKDYPEVELEHMYVDNAAMQLVKSPGQFDTIVTGNLFGDILSDQASACVGSIGLLASAS
ncbi:MAG: 3-isopropylmalate dehydrogenase, partial [Pseudomonadota bacterium]|nr:3-isopropylmalate dehydrogenase [Pseudomonadota bacterium]